MDDAAPMELTGRDGQRRLCIDGRPEFVEHSACGWFILGPSRSWPEWRELARLVLATPDPDDR